MENLKNQRFSDDIVLFASNSKYLKSILTDLKTESLKVGLKINIEKTKILTNQSTNTNTLLINGNQYEIVENFKYLGQLITRDGNKDSEIQQRISHGWRQYGRLNKIFKNEDLPLNLKKKAFDQCVLPTLTYGSETWNTTKTQETKIQIAQRGMERSMLGIKRIDKIRNNDIRQRTKLIDSLQVAKRNKWRWAGHIARQQDNRWTKLTTEWQPLNYSRRQGRPRERWRNDLHNFFGNDWSTWAGDRRMWRAMGEVFVQQWTTNDCN